jgi:hypothetical protein
MLSQSQAIAFINSHAPIHAYASGGAIVAVCEVVDRKGRVFTEQTKFEPIACGDGYSGSEIRRWLGY